MPEWDFQPVSLLAGSLQIYPGRTDETERAFEGDTMTETDVELLRQAATHIRQQDEVAWSTVTGTLNQLAPNDPPWNSRTGPLLGGIARHALHHHPASGDPVTATNTVVAAGPAALADLIDSYADSLEGT